ncbi:putative endonuclease [Jejuia pallidilutea]|uniref:Putative endonuclease n=1 Tax=Jejuia pallidilutea TaxID=504487 RepID=A0A362X568_9FLAO|nr:putative endonuclease [Jejuia pallidilutea]
MLYIGFTSNIKERIKAHQSGRGAFFTKKYNVFDLIYYEIYDDSKLARKRERQLKNWNKEWKWNLIKTSNPDLIKLEI